MSTEEDWAENIHALFRKCLKKHQSSHPDSSIDIEILNLTTRLSQSRIPFGRGHFSDVFRGELDDKTKVAVKVLRLPLYTPHRDHLYEAVLLRFFREMSYWHSLQHINIARMLGFTLTQANFGFVSLWYANGNLVQYLENNPDASRFDLVLDVAEGLAYLHTAPRPLIHADLKGVNVFIKGNGVACLGDFGISVQINDLNARTGFTTTGVVTGTTPWMAPELLSEEIKFTLASDIYALAGLFLEIFCPGKYPYHYISNEAKMIVAKFKGELPNISHYPELQEQEEFWKLMLRCWNGNPKERPGVQEIINIVYEEARLIPRVVESVVYRPLTEREAVMAEKAQAAIGGEQIESELLGSIDESGGSRRAYDSNKADMRKHKHILELVAVTESYLRKLEALNSTVLRAVRTQRPPIIHPDEMESFIAIVFHSLSKFRALQKKFLQALYARHRKQGAVIWSIGDVVLGSMEEFSDAYPLYAEGLSAAARKLEAETETNWEFRSLLEKYVGEVQIDRVDPQAILNLPSDHLKSCQKILADIITETDTIALDYADLKAASGLLQRSLNIGKLRTWQNASNIPFPHMEWQWRDLVDQDESIRSLPDMELERQQLIFEIIQKEMSHVNAFDKVITNSRKRDLSTRLFSDVFPHFTDVNRDHRNLVLRLHLIQRNEYPVVRSIVTTLLDAALNWKGLYEGYVKNYPLAVYDIELQIQRLVELHEGRPIPLGKVDVMIDFVQLVVPGLKWYQNALRGLAQVTPPTHEDQTLIPKLTEILDGLISDIEPLLAKSSERAELLTFLARLRPGEHKLQDLDPLNKAHKLAHSGVMWRLDEIDDTIAHWYPEYMVLLDTYLLLFRIERPQPKVAGYPLSMVIPVENLVLGNWVEPSRQVRLKEDQGTVEVFPTPVINETNGERISYKLYVESEELREIWRTKLKEVIEPRRPFVELSEPPQVLPELEAIASEVPAESIPETVPEASSQAPEPLQELAPELETEAEAEIEGGTSGLAPVSNPKSEVEAIREQESPSEPNPELGEKLVPEPEGAPTVEIEAEGEAATFEPVLASKEVAMLDMEPAPEAGKMSSSETETEPAAMEVTVMAS